MWCQKSIFLLVVTGTVLRVPVKLFVLESSIIQDFALAESIILLLGFSYSAVGCNTLRLQSMCVCVCVYIHAYIYIYAYIYK